MLYLTPGLFTRMGLGIDTSTFDDFELRSILNGASARLNALAAAPNVPLPHDFRGGTITGERHRWHLGNEVTQASRRFYPWHSPMREVTQFRIYVTEGSYIEIDPADTFFNPGEGYVEVVALTLGVGVFPVVANLGMTQPVGEMNYTYGRVLAVVAETLFNEGANTVYRAQNQWWHTDPAPVVRKNGTVVTTGFSIDSDEGTVTFSPAIQPTDVVSVDYSHKLHPNLARAVGLLAVDTVGQSSLAAKGLVGVGRIRVAEVEIARPFGSVSARGGGNELLAEVDSLLEPFKFRSVGGV